MLMLFLIYFLPMVSPEDGWSSSPEAVLADHHDYSYNLSVIHLTPRTMGLAWSCRNHLLHDKYEVTLKPLKATYRVVETVPRNTCSIIMDNLVPNTDYQVSVTKFSGKLRQRSNSLTVRTLLEESEIMVEPDEVFEETSRELKLPRVRLVELSLVGLALVLWAGAIVLFFHRWGKIRMLLPYQPDFKEMKQTSSTCTNCSITPHHQCSRLQMQIQAEYHGLGGGTGIGPLGLVAVTDSGCSPMRPRLNSFIGYNQSDIPIPTEIRIYRRARSAENLPLSPKFDDFQDF